VKEERKVTQIGLGYFSPVGGGGSYAWWS